MWRNSRSTQYYKLYAKEKSLYLVDTILLTIYFFITCAIASTVIEYLMPAFSAEKYIKSHRLQSKPYKILNLSFQIIVQLALILMASNIIRYTFRNYVKPAFHSLIEREDSHSALHDFITGGVIIGFSLMSHRGFCKSRNSSASLESFLNQLKSF